jgi:small-conductance mechanosensitive channel
MVALSDPSIMLLLRVGVTTGVAAVVSLGIYIGVRRGLRGSRLKDPVKSSILLLIAGPLAATIVGASLIETIEFSASYIPPPLGASELVLVVELGVLAVVVRTLGAVAKRIMFHLTGAHATERVLVYGIYALGIVGVAYVLLTSPANPVAVTGIWQLVGFIAGLTVTYLVAYVVSAVSRRYGEVLYGKEPQLRTIVVFVRRLLVALVVLVGVATATFTSFPSAGAAVASLFVAAGFASIVVGLAAQSSLANIFAGMIISTSQPFRVGDAVLFKNEWAWVEDIRLSFTILKTWDNRRLVVPNQLFLGEALINYDMKDSSKLCIVFVTITYESDVDKAIEIMKEAARRHPDFLPAGNLPVVHLMDIGDANGAASDANASPGVSLRLLSNAKDQPTNFQMSKDLLYTIRKEFQKSGIQIAYPRREVYLRGEPLLGPGSQSDGNGRS